MSDPFSFEALTIPRADNLKHMLDSAETTVAQFIRRHGLFAGAEAILLAISGGADSIALLHVLEMLRAHRLLDAKLVCAHVNHQLRGGASDQDERFVTGQAAGLGLPVVTTRVDVQAHARQHRLSLETAARQLRFGALSQMARDRDCAWVTTGHQKNDNAETVIHRLRRGTGLRGLAGIRPARQFGGGLWLARPLLCLTRDDILQYLGRRGLPWREDHTNIDTAYTRNYIRHRLLPVLQQESEHPIIEELSDLAAGAGRLYDRIRRKADDARRNLAACMESEVSIRAPDLASLFEPVAIELIRLALASLGCGERNLTERHYRGILRLARHAASRRSLSLPEGFVARREQDTVILSKARPATAHSMGLASPQARDATDNLANVPAVDLTIPGVTRFAGYEIHAGVVPRDKIQPEKIEGDKSPFIEYLDLDQVKPPIVVRSRRAGDRFQPLGMTGEKKVGKFLTTAKVPCDQRKRILIFADGERIVWVCPIRIGERAKVTENTQQVLELKVTGQ